MKLIAISILLFAPFAVSQAGSELSPTMVRITETSTIPSLRAENVRIDARDGRIRGTARVNFGYAAPQSAHVRVEALDGAGEVIASGCDNLSRQSLTGHPRLPSSHNRGDAFSVRLPTTTASVQSIRVVIEGDNGKNCNPTENRFWSLFRKPMAMK